MISKTIKTNKKHLEFYFLTFPKPQTLKAMLTQTMKRFLLAITIIAMTACNQQNPTVEKKTLDFGSFSIVTPQSWTAIKKNGIDSYVGSIAIDDKDTISYDLGWYSNKLYEYDPIILDSNMRESIDTSMVDMDEIIFVKSRMKVDPDNFRNNNILWDTIDGRRAKIVYPRISGIGTTGIYIDSLWGSGSSIDRFNLYGTNLKLSNEKEVLQALQTLKFRNK